MSPARKRRFAAAAAWCICTSETKKSCCTPASSAQSRPTRCTGSGGRGRRGRVGVLNAQPRRGRRLHRSADRSLAARRTPGADVAVREEAMIPLLVALALAPWTHPLAFQPLPGWRTGASGTTNSLHVVPTKSVPAPKESAAWIARNVRYRDRATADPPNATLMHLPRAGVIVWAVIIQSRSAPRPIRLDLALAKRFDCCEGAYVAYAVIVRIYFGSRPTAALRSDAQRALDHLELPLPKR